MGYGFYEMTGGDTRIIAHGGDTVLFYGMMVLFCDEGVGSSCTTPWVLHEPEIAYHRREVGTAFPASSALFRCSAGSSSHPSVGVPSSQFVRAFPRLWSKNPSFFLRRDYLVLCELIEFVQHILYLVRYREIHAS